MSRISISAPPPLRSPPARQHHRLCGPLGYAPQSRHAELDLRAGLAGRPKRRGPAADRRNACPSARQMVSLSDPRSARHHHHRQPRTRGSTTCSAAAGLSATASASAARDSPGPACRRSRASPNGRIGSRREEMLQRQPYLPRFMAGGPAIRWAPAPCTSAAPIYRIHGTNAPETIGTHVSSGCIRMLNEDVVDLYGRVSVGTKVVVLPDRPRLEAVRSLLPQPAGSLLDDGKHRCDSPFRPLLGDLFNAAPVHSSPPRPGSRAAGSSPRSQPLTFLTAPGRQPDRDRVYTNV